MEHYKYKYFYTLRYFRLGCWGAASLWLAAECNQPVRDRPCVSSLTTSDLFVGGSWAGVWAKPQLNVGGGLVGIGLASLMESFGIGVLDP